VIFQSHPCLSKKITAFEESDRSDFTAASSFQSGAKSFFCLLIPGFFLYGCWIISAAGVECQTRPRQQRAPPPDGNQPSVLMPGSRESGRGDPGRWIRYGTSYTWPPLAAEDQCQMSRCNLSFLCSSLHRCQKKQFHQREHAGSHNPFFADVKSGLRPKKKRILNISIRISTTSLGPTPWGVGDTTPRGQIYSTERGVFFPGNSLL
jgi:hypothetical protein